MELVSLRCTDLCNYVSVNKHHTVKACRVEVCTGQRAVPGSDKGKMIPLHAMEAHGGKGGIAPTHS
jgi:hypothetical protein